MVKVRISATVDEKTEKRIEKLSKKNKYRNRSHMIEEAINRLFEKEGKNE